MIVSPKKAINLSCDSDLYKKEIFNFYAAKALACKCDFGFTKHYNFSRLQKVSINPLGHAATTYSTPPRSDALLGRRYVKS